MFDDYRNIVQNEALHQENYSLQSLVGAAFSGESGPSKRPVSTLSFLANHELFGRSPFHFKLVNLLIHLASGLLLYTLLRQILERACPERGLLGERAALLAALLWLVHPINLSAVLYTVQRMTALAALFSFTSLLVYVRIRSRQMAGAARGNLPYWGAFFLSGALALGSKENAALLPIALFLVERTCFQFRAARYLKWGYTALFLASLLALAYLISAKGILASDYGSRPFSPIERLLTEFRVVAYYLKQILLPNPFSMALLHTEWQISKGLTDPISTLLSALLHASVIGSAYWLRKRYKIFFFGVAWFYLWHLLESTIVLLELVHEHRNYIASAGPLLIVSCLLTSRPWREIPAMGVLALGLFLVLGSMTTYRAWRWGDPVTLALLEWQHNPNSERAAYEYARVLLNAYLDGPHPQLLSEARSTLEGLAMRDSADPLPLVGLINSYLIAGENPPHPLVDKFSARVGQGAPVSGEIGALEILTACQTPPGPCRLSPDVVLGPMGALLANNDVSLPTRALVLDELALYYANALGDLPAAGRAAAGAVQSMPEQPLYRLRVAEIFIESGDLEGARQEVSAADALARKSNAWTESSWLTRRQTVQRKLARAMLRNSTGS